MLCLALSDRVSLGVRVGGSPEHYHVVRNAKHFKTNTCWPINSSTTSRAERFRGDGRNMLHRGDAGAHRRRSREAVGGGGGRWGGRRGVSGGNVQAAEDQALQAATGKKPSAA